GYTRGRSFDLGSVKINPGKPMEAWATIQATVVDGASFEDAKKILITATGYAENTGMKWTNDKKESVGRNWGKRPSLVEGVPAKIVFTGKGNYRAWALDETGQRRVEVPMKDGSLQIGPEHRTLWYEVGVE